MSSSVFKFREFSVRQRDSGMKVGTDGVLLGAWTSCEKPQGKVLDIGTGTGLIALMLAQRFPHLFIDAIDLDCKAAAEAQYNFKQSPWAERLQSKADSLQQHALVAGKVYSDIVCNPPFYPGSYTIKDVERDQARNQLFLPLDELFCGVNQLLGDKGKFSLILPIAQKDRATLEATKNKLFLSRFTAVRGNEKAPIKRALLEYSREELPCISKTLTLEVARHQHTLAYHELVKAFYLAKP